ncbi:MAG: sigma-54-dependent Fis family transcriptional regulator [Myxococcales bacterium]|nr:sigma-54-dependent Fis family transcriptional regulator [Myxococcales bacterium]
MRADDLDHHEFLQLNPTEGLIQFGGERALLVDAVAMGLLRKNLVDSFGATAARTVLTQFGFANGWRMSEAIQSQFESAEEWALAGTRLPALGGLCHFEASSQGPLSKEGAVMVASYEAEQHLLHFGQANHCVCWTMCGLLSGFLSRATGKEIFVLEDRCLASGAAACHLVGRTREAWGDENSAELNFFDKGDLSELLGIGLKRVVEELKTAERKLLLHHRALVRVAAQDVAPLGLVARSAPMRRVVDLARRVAKVDATVLLTGESGSGKERVARLVHDDSMRASGPFIAVNCGAITETLLESELFGHARGAFTGAAIDRPGLFEAANHGTLLLDEVGEVSPGMQVKLLRALQEHEVRRVGENKSRKVDVRIIAATNRDLAAAVTAGTFRQDLFYRLKVVELHVPALRDRREDVLPLARVLLGVAAQRMQRNITALSPGAADHLLASDWPGNVRQLENAMERAVALARGDRIEVEDLPEDVCPGLALPTSAIGAAVRHLDEVERDYILAALAVNNGNQTRTAQQLKIGSATLYRKLKRYGALGVKPSAQADRS